MTEIRFYHLQKTDLDRAVFQLALKIHQMGKRTQILSPDQGRIDSLDKSLWTLGGEAFLPHGTKKDGRPKDQPVWLTTTPQNENDASVLILCDQAETSSFEDYDICCEIFDGNNDEDLLHARKKWQIYKKQKINLSYWQQDSKGRWQKTD